VTALGTQSDEGVHVTVAERVALGDTIYSELFENRTPGVELFLAAVFRLVGSGVFLARQMSLATVALTISGLVLSGTLLQQLVFGRRRPNGMRLSSHLAGWAAGVSFGLAPLAIFWSRFVMLEHWQAAAATLAISAALLAVREGRILWWIVSGIMTALAILAKQSGLVVMAAMIGFLLLIQFASSRRPKKRSLVFWFLGLLPPILLFLLWLWLNGALNDFARFLTGAERLAPTTGLSEKAHEFIIWLVRGPLLYLSLAGALGMILSRQLIGWLPLLWGLGEVAALFSPAFLDLGWGGFSHYAIPAIAALSLLGGVGLAQVALWAVGSQWQRVLAAAFLVTAITMASGWLGDLNYAFSQREYPQAGFADEKQIGQMAAAVSGEADPILVLGNASLYHWAQRRPASRFFQLPGYLPESGLWEEVEADLLSTFSKENLGTLLISRMHLEDRFSETLRQSLEAHWMPVALFEYPYQRDVFLYQRKPTGSAREGEPLASFDAAIRLERIEVEEIGSQTLEVRLWWSADTTPINEWTVFVHLLDSKGQVLTQRDSVPVVGFRPTSSWAPGEVIVDSHWLSTPAGEQSDDLRLAIGLYDSNTGQRSILRNVPGKMDSYVWELGIEAQ
jgi:hypothetical protein